MKPNLRYALYALRILLAVACVLSLLYAGDLWFYGPSGSGNAIVHAMNCLETALAIAVVCAVFFCTTFVNRLH